MTYVSFPGLFEKVLGINPVAFSVFGLKIHWYGLIICTGIILAVINTVRCARREGISTDDVLDYAIFAVPIAIIGARLYYVITSPGEYRSFWEVIAIWNGGLAIYGAVIAGAVTVFAVSKYKKMSFAKIADSIATSLLVGQMIGRWGNFCNGEAFGHLDRFELLGKSIATPQFQDNYIFRMLVSSNATDGREMLVHPTFLYESLWNLAGFIILTLVYRKKKFDGQIILGYLAWYGLGRFFVEGLRADSLMLGSSNIRISQLLALLTFIFALAATAVILARKKKEAAEDGEYENQFGNTERSENECCANNEQNTILETEKDLLEKDTEDIQNGDNN